MKRLTSTSKYLPAKFGGKSGPGAASCQQYYRLCQAGRPLLSLASLAGLLLAGPCPAARPAQARPELVLQVGHTGVVATVAFSPDDRILASGADDNTVKLWYPATGELVRTLVGHRSTVFSVAFSPDGRTLASGSMDHTVKLWNAHTGALKQTLMGHGEQVMSVAFSPNGKLLASGSWDRTVGIWNPATGRLVRTLTGSPDQINAIAFSPDGKIIAGASIRNANPFILLWDTASGKPRRALAPPPQERVSYSNPYSLAFSPDGTRLACGSSEGVQIWDPVAGNLLYSLEKESNSIRSVAWSHNGRVLAAASADHLVRLWDTQTGRRLPTLAGHTALVTAVAWSHAGFILAGGSQDATVRLWNSQTGHLLRILPGCQPSPGKVLFSPDGETLVCSDTSGSVRLWRMGSNFLMSTLVAGKEQYRNLAFSPDNRLLAGAQGSIIRLWDPLKRTLKHSFIAPGASPGPLAFSPDSRTLAVGDRNCTVSLWDVRSGKLKRVLREPQAVPAIESLAFLPGGRQLVMGCDRIDANGKPATELQFWDLSMGKTVQSVTLPYDILGDIAVDRSGGLVATGGDRGPQGQGMVAVWNRNTRRMQWVSILHDGSLGRLCFSSDGRWLASTGGDGTIRLWDPLTGKLGRSILAHNGDSTDIAFSPSGRLLVSAGFDGAIKLWNSENGRLLATILQLPGARDGSRVAPADWIVFTPDGFYDGVPGAERFIRWRVGARLYPSAWGHQRFHRPDLVRRSIQKGQ